MDDYFHEASGPSELASAYSGLFDSSYVSELPFQNTLTGGYQAPSNTFSWDTLNRIVSSVGNLANTAVNVYRAVNPPEQPVAGVYTASGRYQAINPGTSAIVGPTGQVLTPSVGSSVSGVFASIKPWLPWLLIGFAVVGLFKLAKKF